MDAILFSPIFKIERYQEEPNSFIHKKMAAYLFMDTNLWISFLITKDFSFIDQFVKNRENKNINYQRIKR